jgi:hypothetical protein
LYTGQLVIVIAGLHSHTPLEHDGVGHASMYHALAMALQVGGHGAQSLSAWHCTPAHAPPMHAVGHSENDISQTQDPISQAALTYETTELEKHVVAG